MPRKQDSLQNIIRALEDETLKLWKCEGELTEYQCGFFRRQCYLSIQR